MLIDSMDAATLSHFKLAATRRMAAIALMLKQYQADHGQLPDSLDDLVPDYIPALPKDPFRSDGGTFGYLPGGAPLYWYEEAWDWDGTNQPPTPMVDKKGPPTLYSLGADLHDDGGLIPIERNGQHNDHKFQKPGDIWFALAPWPMLEPHPSYDPDAEDGSEFDFMLDF